MHAPTADDAGQRSERERFSAMVSAGRAADTMWLGVPLLSVAPVLSKFVDDPTHEDGRPELFRTTARRKKIARRAALIAAAHIDQIGRRSSVHPPKTSTAKTTPRTRR
jgi:hypothetical protein